MRIIGGEFRSRRLKAPSGLDTRPTLDRRRESLFNILQHQIAGSRVLDLFAGSGSLGLESLSRGAAYAVFCDRSRQACYAISQNIISLGVEERSELHCMPYQRMLDLLKGLGKGFDIIFLDPPYAADYDEILRNCISSGLLLPSGMMIVEHSMAAQIQLPEGYEVVRSKTYGDAQIDIVRKAENTDE